MRLLRNTLIVTIVSLVGATIGYLFNPLLIASHLGTPGISLLGAYCYLYSLLAIPQRPLTWIMTQAVSRAAAPGTHDGSVGAIIRRYTLRLFQWGLLLFGGVLLFGGGIARFLNLPSAVPVIACGGLAVAGLLMTGVHSALLGLLRFREYSASLLMDPFCRVVFGVLLVQLGLGALGAMLAYIIGYGAAVLFGFWLLRDYLSFEKVTRVRGESLPVGTLDTWLCSVYYAIAFSVDVLMVKHYFPDHDAGVFIAAATLAKMTFLAVGPISTIAYSTACSEAPKGARVSPMLWKSLGLTGCVCFVIVGGAIWFPSHIIKLTYGIEFREASTLLPLACVAIVPLALITVLTQYYLALQFRLFSVGLLVGAVVQIVLISQYHQTLIQVIYVCGLGGVIQCLLLVGFCLPETLRWYGKAEETAYPRIGRSSPGDRRIDDFCLPSGPRRVVVFTGHFHPHVGGVERYTRELWKRLTRRGWTVSIVTGNTDGSPHFERIDGLSVIRLPVIQVVDGRLPILLPSPMLIRAFGILTRWNPQIVVTNTRFFSSSIAGILFARARTIPTLHIEHGSEFISLGSRLANVLSVLYDSLAGSWVVRSATRTVGVSESVVGFLNKLGGKRAGILYNGVDTKQLPRPERGFRKQHNIGGQDTIMAFVGRLVEDKGILVLLDALGRLQPDGSVHLLIAGDGHLLETIRHRSRTLPNVHVLGALPPDEVGRLLQDCDIFIHPSSCPEGLPTSVLEAGAAGCAIIATPKGGTGEIIPTPEEGILIPPGDAVSLARALSELLNDPARRSRMGKRVQERVRSMFDLERVTDAAEKILREIMNREDPIDPLRLCDVPHNPQ